MTAMNNPPGSTVRMAEFGFVQVSAHRSFTRSATRRDV
jgi:hypothetical protein